MKLIIVSGPSGSGKTTLSKRILKKFKQGIILNTDNYYRTGLISQIFSKILTSYFDRKISFNKKLFKRDLVFILKNNFSNHSYKYNFKTKTVKKKYKKTQKISYVIVEGIFGNQILETYSDFNCILIKLKTNKNICMKRAIKRDFNERGKSKNLAKRDFIKAWKLFYKNKKNENSVKYQKKFIVRKKNDINLLLKIITKTLN
tara:strand:+ start:405 stop:1010 length:606 start_codon:yes stop_codon:yes gene_type:complete